MRTIFAAMAAMMGISLICSAAAGAAGTAAPCPPKVVSLNSGWGDLSATDCGRSFASASAATISTCLSDCSPANALGSTSLPIGACFVPQRTQIYGVTKSISQMRNANGTCAPLADRRVGGAVHVSKPPTRVEAPPARPAPIVQIPVGITPIIEAPIRIAPIVAHPMPIVPIPPMRMQPPIMMRMQLPMRMAIPPMPRIPAAVPAPTKPKPSA